MSDTVLNVTGISRAFGSEQAVEDLHLTLRDDEILTLIGPSGCGKTTAMRIIAGLETPDEGTVELNGETVTGNDVFVPPEQRNVGFVFQDLALFPHMTVRENVAFGLDADADDPDERGNDILELVGLSSYRDRYPNDLSGGQQQRVALARSLVVRPSVLLMDEPFNNLDNELRERLRRDVREILKERQIPTLFVTHHQEEAISLGDRTAVMSEGSIEQVGRPEDVVIQPGSRFVAEFLGPTEFLPARKTADGIETEVQTLPADMVDTPGTEDFDLMIRADDIQIEPTQNGNADGVVEDAQFLGGLFRYKIRLSSGRHVYSLLNHSEQLRPDTPVKVELDPGHQLVGFESSS
jgi:iron(III) transport system ATP-binding protein